MISINKENMTIFTVEDLHLTEIPIIKLGNDYYTRKKNTTDSYDTYLRTETSSMHKIKSLPELQ